MCLNPANTPFAPAHPWIISHHQSWERLYIDYVQCGKYLLLILVHAFAKWPEVHLVSSTLATQKIDKKILFAARGVLVTLVSDNGSPFTSVQLKLL